MSIRRVTIDDTAGVRARDLREDDDPIGPAYIEAIPGQSDEWVKSERDRLILEAQGLDMGLGSRNLMIKGRRATDREYWTWRESATKRKMKLGVALGALRRDIDRRSRDSRPEEHLTTVALRIESLLREIVGLLEPEGSGGHTARRSLPTAG